MSGDASRHRILVVDDEKEILDLTRVVLSHAGYEVRTVSSGEDALGLIGDTRFDMVLLDINMPGMDGWETLRLIRADDDLQALPVVMFSVKGEVRDKIHSLQEGATDYVTKPFVVDTLLVRVQRILEQRGESGRSGLAEETPGP